MTFKLRMTAERKAAAIAETRQALRECELRLASAVPCAIDLAAHHAMGTDAELRMCGTVTLGRAVEAENSERDLRATLLARLRELEATEAV